MTLTGRINTNSGSGSTKECNVKLTVVDIKDLYIICTQPCKFNYRKLTHSMIDALPRRYSISKPRRHIWKTLYWEPFTTPTV